MKTAHPLLIATIALRLLAPSAARGAPNPRSLWPSRRHVAVLVRADTLFAHDKAAGYAFLDSVIAVARERGARGLEGVAQVRRATSRLFLDRRLDEARQVSQSWADEFRDLRDTLSWCHALRNVGAAYLFGERYPQADDAFRRMLDLTAAARLPEAEAYAWIGRSFVAMKDGRMHDAENGYRRALRRAAQYPDARAERTALAGLANVHSQTGRIDEARREYERARDQARAAGDMRNLGDALNDLGSIEFRFGDPGRAAALYREAGAVYRAAGLAGAGFTSRLNEGRCLMSLQRVDEAAALFDSMVTFARSIGARDDEAFALTLLGRARMLQQRPAEAEATLRTAIAQGDSISTQAYADAAQALAWVLRESGRPDESALFSRATLTRLETHLAPDQEAGLLFGLGRAELEAGRPAEALSPLRRSLVLRRTRPGMGQIIVMNTEQALARSFRALAERDSALFHFRLAAEAWERSRTAPNDPDWREAFSGAAAGLFCQYAVLLLDPAAGGSPEQRAAVAFEVLQQFRARALEEQLLGTEGSLTPPRVSLADLRGKVLENGEVFLDVYPSSDTTIVLAIARDRILSATASGLNILTDRLKRLGDLLQSRVEKEDAARGAEDALGAELFGSVADLIHPARRVLLSAGKLDGYPLARLRVPGENRALGEGRELGLVPSATLLAKSRRSAPPGLGAGGFLGLSRVTGPGGVVLAGVRRETRELQARFPKGDYRVNQGQRTLEEMLADVSAHEVLHLSSHTRWSEAAPWRAGFLLGRGDGEEAYLTAPRICRLRGAARLCVLASCSSAGRSVVSESMPPLGAAWLTAGASAVIATLWPVDDEATAGFVGHFYDALQRGQSAGAALTDAQAAIRSTRGREASGYWAGFVLLGDPATRVRLPAPASSKAPAPQPGH